MNWHITSPGYARRYSGFGGIPFALLQRELGRAYEADACGAKSAKPVRLDVREDSKSYVIAADLPGLEQTEVEVTFEDGVLTIQGEKKAAARDEKDTWHMAERFSGTFSRQLSVPAAIEADKIEATFDKGVLTVTLPKQAEEQTKAKKIEIKTH